MEKHLCLLWGYKLRFLIGIDYQATFEHINSLGKAELSLIKEVKIHELIHTVQVNHSNPDNLPDFLVNETFDAQFTPDIIYFSSGGTAPVKAVKNATIDATPTLSDLTVQITATVENGWTYFRLDEPSNSQYDIVKIQRSDGTEIGLDNFWTTDRTFPATGRPTYENILHTVDDRTGTERHPHHCHSQYGRSKYRYQANFSLKRVGR